MAKKPKKFIQNAISRPGDLTRKAKAAGKSVGGYCSSLGKNASTRSKQQCNLAKTLNKVRPMGMGSSKKKKS